jgi:hypothetical protein
LPDELGTEGKIGEFRTACARLAARGRHRLQWDLRPAAGEQIRRTLHLGQHCRRRAPVSGDVPAARRRRSIPPAPLAAALARALVFPAALARAENGARHAERAATPSTGNNTARSSAWQGRIERTMQELIAAYQGQAAQDLAQKRNGSGRGTVRPALDSAATAKLSTTSQSVLRSLSVDISARPIATVMTELQAAMSLPPRDAVETTPLPMPGPSAPSALADAQVRPSGIADLLIVKQHLVGYQRTDIAHVENVMAHETREREHRLLERSEVTTILEREQIDQKETELQTAERFELQQETQQTIQRDQQVGFGSHGLGQVRSQRGSLEQRGGELLDRPRRTRRAARSTYAKDVMERSLQRVTQRVREGADPQAHPGVRGNQQARLQERNRRAHRRHLPVPRKGIREPDLQLRHSRDVRLHGAGAGVVHLGAEKAPGNDVALPPAPPKLKDFVTSAAGINLGNFREIAAAVGARGVEAAPAADQVHHCLASSTVKPATKAASRKACSTRKSRCPKATYRGLPTCARSRSPMTT